MIRLIHDLPEIETLSAEWIRIKCLFDAYQDDDSVLFWWQEESGALLSLSDGDMTIFNPSGEAEEMRSFLSMIAPKTVFSDANTLTLLGLTPYRKLSVLCRKADLPGDAQSDAFDSRELYDLMRSGGLSLPDYPAFAVDICRRLNRGGAVYFGRKEKGAAIACFSGDTALLTGIVSRQKGFGTAALHGILQKNRGRTVLACCEESVKPFYLKNGFRTLYDAGSWKYEHS